MQTSLPEYAAGAAIWLGLSLVVHKASRELPRLKNPDERQVAAGRLAAAALAVAAMRYAVYLYLRPPADPPLPRQVFFFPGDLFLLLLLYITGRITALVLAPKTRLTGLIALTTLAVLGYYVVELMSATRSDPP